jgi:hypothetical protein
MKVPGRRRAGRVMLTGLQGFSFKEKSLASSLVAVAMVYGGCFLGVWQGNGASTLADMLGAMIGMEVAKLLLAGLVLSEIVYYTAQLYLYRRGVHG